MSLTLYEREPKQVKADHGEAWWYAYRSGIELHISDGMTHFTVKIPMAQLRELVNRMGKKP